MFNKFVVMMKKHIYNIFIDYKNNFIYNILYIWTKFIVGRGYYLPYLDIFHIRSHKLNPDYTGTLLVPTIIIKLSKTPHATTISRKPS